MTFYLPLWWVVFKKYMASKATARPVALQKIALRYKGELRTVFA